jgi:hypothetical protein
MPRTCHPCRQQSRRKQRWICGRLSRRSQLRPKRFGRKASSRWVVFGVVAGLSGRQLRASAARRDWSLCETSLTLLDHLLQQPQLPDLKVLIYSLSLVNTDVLSRCWAIHARRTHGPIRSLWRVPIRHHTQRPELPLLDLDSLFGGLSRCFPDCLGGQL